MEAIIKKRLSEIESKHKVKILHACESGSRAWGFPSPDSDYDVRFIYIHMKDWYLSIDDKKDSIEVPINDELDISGWEIRKALKLYRKSNVLIFEHLQSPIIYANYNGFYSELTELSPLYFSPRAALHHYLSMAKNAIKSFEGESVKLKKYFYALRTSLAGLWIIERDSVPPLLFTDLLDLIKDKEIVNQIDHLMEIKAKKNETYLNKRDIYLEEYIMNTIEFCDSNNNIFDKKITDSGKLNILFRKYLNMK